MNEQDWNLFTRDGYVRMLELATARYALGPVRSYETVAALWRHDVDCSPQAALAFARLEADRGIAATYYVNQRSEFYNLFERANARVVHEIAALGHEVGLHVDASLYELTSDKALVAVIDAEACAFKALVGLPIQSFSFHNPGPHTTGFTADSYAGLLNAYGNAVMARRAYCSDSNGYWRYEPLPDFLAGAHERICVLTHPEWWTPEPRTPRQRIVRCIDGRAAATLQGYDELLARHGRRNVE